jgi:hypothetical protein
VYGFDSLTATHDLARWYHDNFACRGKISAIMHLGDHDQSGVSIFGSVRDDVRAFLEKDVPILLVSGTARRIGRRFRRVEPRFARSTAIAAHDAFQSSEYEVGV